MEPLATREDAERAVKVLLQVAEEPTEPPAARVDAARCVLSFALSGEEG